MEQKIDLLLDSLHAIFPLSEALRAHLKKIIKFRKIQKNGYLLRVGEINRDIHFIMKGFLRCYYLHDGQEVSSWFMKEWDSIVSIGSFYKQKPSYEFIQAMEETEMFYITFIELQETRKRFLEFNYIGWELTTNYLILWDQQLYGIRMLSSEERYQFLLENSADLLQRVPAKHLASFCDLHKITLSKTKAKIRKPKNSSKS